METGLRVSMQENGLASPKKMGWKATTSLAQGLTATSQWLTDNPELVAEGRAKTVLEVAR